MLERIPKVVVVGGTYVDMAIKCRQIPLPGRSVAGSALSCTTTGPGPNQAMEAALCGCEVYLISKVGGDTFAQMAKETLVDFNVNTDLVYSAEAKNTGVIVTLVPKARTPVVYIRAPIVLYVHRKSTQRSRLYRRQMFAWFTADCHIKRL
jgi:sugar/nucleoside kinase (ribokinase family)